MCFFCRQDSSAVRGQPTRSGPGGSGRGGLKWSEPYSGYLSHGEFMYVYICMYVCMYTDDIKYTIKTLSLCMYVRMYISAFKILSLCIYVHNMYILN